MKESDLIIGQTYKDNETGYLYAYAGMGHFRYPVTHKIAQGVYVKHKSVAVYRFFRICPDGFHSTHVIDLDILSPCTYPLDDDRKEDLKTALEYQSDPAVYFGMPEHFVYPGQIIEPENKASIKDHTMFFAMTPDKKQIIIFTLLSNNVYKISSLFEILPEGLVIWSKQVVGLHKGSILWSLDDFCTLIDRNYTVSYVSHKRYGIGFTTNLHDYVEIYAE